MGKKKRRRSYIVKKNFQFRYVGVIVLLLLSAAILVAVNIYYQMGRLVMENVHVVGIVSFLKSVNLTLAVWFAFIIIVVVFFGIFFSHRIAGPLKHLEDSMARIGRGDFTKYVKIRKKDEFKDLIDVFNKMVISLRQLVLKDRSILKEISMKVENLSNQLKKETLAKHDIDILRDEVNKLSSMVDELTKEFTI